MKSFPPFYRLLFPRSYFFPRLSLPPPTNLSRLFSVSPSTSLSFSQMAPKMLLRHRTRAEPQHDSDGSIESIRCGACRSGEADAELLLCDNCDAGYHTFCLRPILPRVPSGSWFCASCSSSSSSGKKTPKKFPLVQTKIVDFFKIKRSSGFEKIESKKRKRKSVCISKKKRKLLPFNPTEDPRRRLEQMASLATALTTTGAVFSNELTYVAGMAPKSANRAALEKGGMQVMSREDKETLIQCKMMMERGEWAPLLVVFDPVEGFTVEADRHIKDLTIITEYVGDVDYLRNRETDEGDSMMTLLSARDKSKSLVICPDKRSNIARFINGINNHTQDGKKKQNLKCVRFDVDGECRVLLIATRDIRKGERLYYDYNGSEHEYPTHHFV